jgi:hypothetical protein
MIPPGLVPFVGRHAELAALKDQLAVMPLVSLFGSLGAGKSRLVAELAPTLGVPNAIVECYPGDRASAVRARAERALRCAPGTLASTLMAHARVLVIDDVHNLRIDEAAQLLSPLLLGPTALGRVLVVGREPLAAVGDAIGELELRGLDADAAAQVWAYLVEQFGTPTAAGSVDAQLARTRGLPLALRREYARARFGDGAWELASLDGGTAAVLEALAVLRLPVAPAAVGALIAAAGGASADVEAALRLLGPRQLIDLVGDGRVAVPEVVRDDVLARLDAGRRAKLEAAAAELIASTDPSASGPRLAWRAGDDAAFGVLDRVARVREVAWHWLAAGDRDRAAAWVLAHRELAARSGGGGELEALLDAIGDRAGATDAGELTTLRIELAARAGRFAEASERAASAGHAAPPVLHAELLAATGDVAAARRVLAAAASVRTASAASPADRLRACAAIAELDLLAGRPDDAAAQLAQLDTATGDPLARARVHLVAARIDEHAGRIAAMRATLARAHGAVKSVPPSAAVSELSAIIDARRAIGLAREGRLAEAATALDAAEATARELDAVAVSDEIVAARALIVHRRGDSAGAAALLRELVRARRERGDELGALRAELDLAELELVRGQPAVAAELASAATASSVRRELGQLAARGQVVVAAVDVLEHRLDAALPRLVAVVEGDAKRTGADAPKDVVGGGVLGAIAGAAATVWLAIARAMSGQRAGVVEAAQAAGPEVRDEVDRKLAGAEVALAAGDVSLALALARETAVLAERARRTIELAQALVIVARLELARGDRASARAAATRAAREAAAAGLIRARVHALLALSALARDDDDPASAVAYARDASELAQQAGLPVERLVAHAALDAISGAEAVADPAAPTAATMAPSAIEAAARLLTDLGLTALRPFRVIDAEGVQSDVADAHPEILRLAGRALAVDGVREVIWRHGQELADLRRRSLLKRLLFLFANAPGKVFSKESIVQAVWNVDYHPLRHDAALFTNIMRIRRLLGEDGSEIIRVTEDGYRFVPPRDFLFVIPR